MKNRTALEYTKVGENLSKNPIKKMFQSKKTVTPLSLFYGLIYGGSTLTFKRYKNYFFTIPSKIGNEVKVQKLEKN